MSRSGTGERVAVGLVAMALAGGPDVARAQSAYQKPPREILTALDAPPPPTVSVSPTKDTLLLVQTAAYPPIADLARPILRLAGARIDPKTNGPARGARVTGLTLMPAEGGQPRPVKLPPGKIGVPDWSPDGKHFATTVTADDRVELWVGDVESATLRKVPGVALNSAFGEAVQWMPGSKALLCKTVPGDRGRPPEAPPAPIGPTVQESAGKAAPVRTFQDLLQNAHDEN